MQVHWYSFQFLVNELAEELEEMYLAMAQVMTKLPIRFEEP